MPVFHKKYKQLLFVSIIIDIVGSALVQNHGCSDVDHDHVGYRCEKYGCGQTGNCSLGPRGIEGDPIFPCTVGRLNYWENFEENLPQVEECPNKDCEPSFLTDIALSNYENDMIVIIINFTVPPASFPMNYYPAATLCNMTLEMKRHGTISKAYLTRLYNYENYSGTSYDRTLKRYLEFPCILMPREVSGLEYRLLNLNLTVFSFKTPLKSGAGNLTGTLQYNVTILSDNVDKDGIKIIAVARYPSQNDLLVVFNRVDGAKSYIVRAVDKDTGDVWGDPLEIYNSRTKLNCSFSGIAFGNVEIEITVVKYGAKKKPVKSLPIYFGVKSVPEEREDSVLVDATTVVLSAASAVVLATILVVLLLYFRRTSKRQKSLKPPGLNPKIVLMYSNKQRENTDVAIAFSDFLKKSFATENIVYEDDEKEKVELSQHINLWYEKKITWCSHVIVIWFPGAEKTSENDYRQNHFPKTLSRVKEKCRNSDKNIICVYFDGISKLRNIPADLRNISKIICFPNEYDCLYQNVTGRKVPNNQSLSNMRKLSQNFPSLHRALEDARYFYKVGISKTPSQSTTISSSNKSSQFGESFSSTISEIDPNCPIHGKHVQFNLDKKIDKSSEKDKKDDFIEVEDDVLSDIHPPSQDDLGSMSSLQLLNAMLEINNMNDDDTEQKAPLLSEQKEAPLPTSDQGCKETRKCLRSAQRLDSEPSISSNDKQNSGFPSHSHDGQYDDLDIHEKEPLLNNLSSGCVNRQHKGQGHYRHILQDPHYHQHPHFYVPTFENGTVPQIQNNRYSECRKKCRRLQLNHSDMTTHLPGHLGPSEMTPYGHGPLGPLNIIGHGPGSFRGPVEIHGPLSPTEMAACGNGPLGPLNIIDHVPGPFRRPVEIHGPPSPSKMTASGNGPLSPLDMTSHGQRSVNGPLEINRPISPLEMTPCGNGPLGPLQMISCGNGPLGPLQMISHGQQFFNDPLEIQGPLGPSGMTNHRRRNSSPSRETFRQNGHTEIANHEQIPLGPMQIDHAVSRHQHCPRQQVLVDSIEADRCGFDFQPPSDDSEPENDLNEMTTSLSCSLEQQSNKDWKDMNLDEKIMHFNS